MTLPSISVIVPMLDEAEVISATLKDLIRTLETHTEKYQIIVIDDGSTDGSYQVVESLGLNNLCLIRSEKNQGIGNAFSLGLTKVELPYVTWFPSDGEFPADQLVPLIGSVSINSAVVCVPSNSFEMRSFFRASLSKFYTFIINSLFKMSLGYYNGISIYSSEHVKQLKIVSKGFTFPLEVLVKLGRMNFTFIEVPVQLQKRTAGDSKAIRLKVLFDVVTQVYKIKKSISL